MSIKITFNTLPTGAVVIDGYAYTYDATGPPYTFKSPLGITSIIMTYIFVTFRFIIQNNFIWYFYFLYIKI